MASHKYEIREICGDWALDIHWGKETITLFFNSRNNAELVKTVLEWEDAHPNSAVPYKPTLTQPNEPLTLEQLREMNGEPVWIANPDALQYGRWGIVDGVYQEEDDQVLMLRNDYSCHYYGKTWLAYRRPPEGENHHG